MTIVSCPPFFFLYPFVFRVLGLDFRRVVENLRSPKAMKRVCFVLCVLVRGRLY
jgi:hypothetical protein